MQLVRELLKMISKALAKVKNKNMINVHANLSVCTHLNTHTSLIVANVVQINLNLKRMM